MNYSPNQVVDELSRYIIGQNEAKRAVAIALRNRYRRSKLPKELQDEITPKNIIMSGPTGVGKTEIARRIAKIVGAPFIKVEATKFTEVGYVGRDVDSMIRDLAEASIRLIKEEKTAQLHDKLENSVTNKLIDILLPMRKKKDEEGDDIAARRDAIKTDYILFIAAGAFHLSKITDLIPELQGRFPLHVTLNALGERELKDILTRTDNALINQYKALLKVDNVDLEFTGEAIDMIAHFAFEENEVKENIGARRLTSVMEKLLDEVSFTATDEMPVHTLNIDADYVKSHLGESPEKLNVRKYIL